MAISVSKLFLVDPGTGKLVADDYIFEGSIRDDFIGMNENETVRLLYIGLNC
jgi:hypothetical protein